jgi:transcriptional regulator with XRE-family HTH domain
MVFKNNKIRGEDETVAEKLHAARMGKDIKIEEAAKKISINPEYLTALERGDYSSLPSGVYAKTFLREYAAFLGLDPAQLEEKYRQEKKGSENGHRDVFSKKKINKLEMLIFPKLLKNLLLFLIVTIFFAYLGYYLLNTFSLPNVQIYQPTDNLVTESNFIDIIGRADSKTQITINNQQVLKDEGGNFSKRVNLKKGLNTIVISAQNKYSRKKIIEKQVLVK